MKTSISCIIALLFLIQIAYGQEDFSKVPSYPANLGKEIYHVVSHHFDFKTASVNINDAQVKTIETEVGVTGFVAVGKITIHVIDEQGKVFNDSISKLLVRFNPATIKAIIDLDKVEISQVSDATELFAFYIESFSTLYHKGKELMIPPTDVIAMYFIANDGKSVWVVNTDGDMKVTVNYTKLVYQMMNRGEMDKALNAAELLYAKHPDDTEVVALLGRALVENKEYEKAIKYLEQATKMITDKAWVTAWSFAYLGKSYFLSGNRSKAKEALDRCIEINATRNATNFAKKMLADYGL